MTAPKSQPEFSLCQSSAALSVLTYDVPTLAWTTGLLVVSKVRYTAAGSPPDWVMICDAVNGWSKTRSKWTVYSCCWPSLLASPQKWPLVCVPAISWSLTICAVLGANSPFWLSCSLTRKPAWVVAGNVNRPIELCDVAVNSDVIVLGWLLWAE